MAMMDRRFRVTAFLSPSSHSFAIPAFCSASAVDVMDCFVSILPNTLRR